MPNTIKGENFIAERQQGLERTGISKDLAVVKLAPETLKSIQATTTYDQVNTSRLDASLKPQFQVPNMSNLTPSGLADLLGEVREELSRLKKLETLYKEALGPYFNEPGPSIDAQGPTNTKS